MTDEVVRKVLSLNEFRELSSALNALPKSLLRSWGFDTERGAIERYDDFDQNRVILIQRK